MQSSQAPRQPAARGFTFDRLVSVPAKIWGVIFAMFGALHFAAALYFWAIPLVFDIIYRGAYKIEGQYYLSAQMLPVSMLAAFLVCLAIVALRTRSEGVAARRWIGLFAFLLSIVNFASLAFSGVFEWIRFSIHERGNGEAVSQMIFDAHRTWVLVDIIILSVVAVVAFFTMFPLGLHMLASFYGRNAKWSANKLLEFGANAF